MAGFLLAGVAVLSAVATAAVDVGLAILDHCTNLVGTSDEKMGVRHPGISHEPSRVVILHYKITHLATSQTRTFEVEVTQI